MLGDDVGPRAALDHTDVHRDPRPSPVQRVQRRRPGSRLRGSRCGPSRVPRRRAQPGPRIRIRRSTIPFRADTMSPLARAHSRTKHASASGARARMIGPDDGEPISSSGFATNDHAAQREGRAAARRLDQPAEREERIQARQQAALHVGHARSVRPPVLHAIRSFRGRSLRETRCRGGRSAAAARPPRGPRTCRRSCRRASDADGS